MKLRNKKTGGIFDVAFHSSYKDGKIVIGVEVDADPKYPKCNFSDYESLEEFCENWEDVKEPLIKDEKIRKAVKAWAEANDIKEIIIFDRSNNAPYTPVGAVEFAGNASRLKVLFRTEERFDTDMRYTVTELCGEEEQ